jgi:hypothetical protein
MKVQELQTPNLVELVMPYEMYRFLLYCMATYENPKDTDMKQVYKNCWEFAESLGAESPHHFISENDGFMKLYHHQLVVLRGQAEAQAEKVAKVIKN